MTYRYGPSFATPVSSHRVADFLNSLGVNTGIASWVTPYVNLSTILSAIQYIGATAIRDRLTADMSYHVPEYAYLAANGIKLVLVSPTDADTPTAVVANCVTAAEDIQKMATNALLAIEHPNEPHVTNYTYSGVTSSNSGNPGFQPVSQFMTDLYRAVKASPYLYNVPLLHISDAGDEPMDGGLQWLTIPYGYSHVTLTTNNSAAQGATSLSFASTTGVQAGAYVYATNVPNGTVVISTTSTTVTISPGVSSGGVANGASVRFGSRMPDSTIFSDIANVHVYPTWGADWGSGNKTSGQSIDPSIAGGGNFLTKGLTDNYTTPYSGSHGGSGPTATQVNAMTKWCSEYGYPTAGITAGGNSVDQATQAKNLLTAWLNAWQCGFSRFFIYELYDDQANTTSASYSFGLYSWNGSGATYTQTAKTAATYLHNFVTILSDTAGYRYSFAPAPLAYTLTGMPSPGGASQLFQATNGTFFLVLWNNVNNWNVATGAPIAIASTAVKVNLPHTMSIAVYDPTVGTSAQSTATSTSVTVNLADYPMIISLA